jgi:hypothetical protein
LLSLLSVHRKAVLAPLLQELKAVGILSGQAVFHVLVSGDPELRPIGSMEVLAPGLRGNPSHPEHF